MSESKAIVNYPWNTIDDLVKEVANRASSFKPTHIVGITRGGLIPAVMLSHSFDLPMETLGVSFRDNRATHHTKFKPIDDARYLIVDDITMTEMAISSFRPNAVDESSFVRALSI